MIGSGPAGGCSDQRRADRRVRTRASAPRMSAAAPSVANSGVEPGTPVAGSAAGVTVGAGTAVVAAGVGAAVVGVGVGTGVDSVGVGRGATTRLATAVSAPRKASESGMYIALTAYVPDVAAGTTRFAAPSVRAVDVPVVRPSTTRTTRPVGVGVVARVARCVDVVAVTCTVNVASPPASTDAGVSVPVAAVRQASTSKIARRVSDVEA